MTNSRTPAGHDEQPRGTDHDLLTLAEAAALLRTPPATLRYWRHLGTGPCSFKIGRHIMYDENDLYGWIEQQRVNGPHVK